MGVTDWARRTVAAARADGLAGLSEGAYELYAGAWRYLGWHVPHGTNVYDREWDVLVILDACRVDLLREIAAEYPFVGTVESMTSVGSMSEEWMAKTFTGEYADEVAETAYVTANVFSDSELDGSAFLELDEVWRYAWDDDLGVVPPRPVTDRAISVAREVDPERLIVHYMQPHHPFIADDVAGFDADDGAASVAEEGAGSVADDGSAFDADPFGREGGKTVVDALRKGDISPEDFRRAYAANLRLVLDDVALLLSNLDAETVVLSADHGEALGEWGIYDHPAGFLHPAVRNVPWVETSARDQGEYAPEVRPVEETDPDVQQRLRDLGYR